MSIDWLAFVTVAVATLIAAVVVVGSYGLGVRLLAVSEDVNRVRPGLVRSAAFACFGFCTLAVLFGVYLIVPALHAK